MLCVFRFALRFSPRETVCYFFDLVENIALMSFFLGATCGIYWERVANAPGSGQATRPFGGLIVHRLLVCAFSMSVTDVRISMQIKKKESIGGAAFEHINIGKAALVALFSACRQQCVLASSSIRMFRLWPHTSL